MLNKMVGAYEPDQLEIKQEWVIKFGNEETDDEETDV